MLKAYRVKNLRGIGDSGFIDIRPITVFVGRNSSGKSTMLRVLPLLRQSVTEDTREPILWFGRSADFGSFDEALSRFPNADSVTFEFRFELPGTNDREVLITESGERVFFAQRPSRSIFIDGLGVVDIGITIKRRSLGDGAYVSAAQLRLGNDVVELIANEKGELDSPRVNAQSIVHSPKLRWRFSRGRFFPQIAVRLPEDAHPEELRRANQLLREGLFSELAAEKISPFVHGNTNKKQLAAKLLFGDFDNFLSHLFKVSKAIKAKLEGNALTSIRKREVEELRQAVFLHHLTNIFRECSDQLWDVGSSVRYLEPVRARAARYYRFQELAVDEIDPQGENVPMFLSSLNTLEQQSLDQWMADALQVKFRATRSGGHAKILVKEQGSEFESNLADTGFGYSQVLPIVLQIWKTQRELGKKEHRKSKQMLLAIEQPELHLHPQFQALLADVFAKAVKENVGKTSNMSLVVETHSEHLISRLGALIQKGRLAPDDVAIYLFDRRSADEATSVIKSVFDSDGVLNDPWPFGFFTPDLP